MIPGTSTYKDTNDVKTAGMYVMVGMGSLDMYMYVHACMHVNSFNETRQSKQLHPKTIPFILKGKNELSQAGFEPAMFCVPGRYSTS